MTPAPFDVCGPLPAGVTVLEAGAGTGKTFTIAALATRYVAEGLPLEHLLIVTFTRMATSELRDRVRRRMVSAELGLRRALLGFEPDAADGVLRLLATGPADEVRRRGDRLTRALSDFDAATIATTHGFCQHVLHGLGVAGDVEPDVGFVDDRRYLVEEVVTDLYVRFFHRPGHRAPFTLAEAIKIGDRAVSNPDAVLVPDDAPPNSPAQLRFRLATRVRQEVDRRRRLAAALTFDDLLTRLRDTLSHPVRGEIACRRLRERYRVALVDEFQDTDPIQWEIMRRAFTGGTGSTLVLIGDPKQAIYAFRGADVYAYLEAARLAGARATLEVNWRSDQRLLDAFDALFAGSRLGHEDIVYREVRAAPANVGRPLPGPPLRVRVLHRDDGLVKLTQYGYASVGDARARIATDLAGDAVRLLTSAGGGVRPGDIAVLVHRNRDALAVRDALEAAGVPAVVNGAGSVFATPSAQAWLRLLGALERPAATGPARLVALSPFIGWTAAQVASAGEVEWEDLHARLHRWAAVLRLRGVAAVLETIGRAELLDRRVLERTDGERELTDLRHIAQLLHGVASADQLGLTALTAWLRARVDGAGEEDPGEERGRRLESDAEAVQILTIHRSKGLEFPVVYCPYLWDPAYIRVHEPPVFHDGAGRRAIDVGGLGPDSESAWRHREESRGEELRLAYVALTRARHLAVVWWAGSYEACNSALGRLLLCRDAEGNVAPSARRTPADDEVMARFEGLGVCVERVDGGAGAGWVDHEPARPELAVASFDRSLDPTWRRTSYTAITSSVHEATVDSEAEERREPDEVVVAPAAAAAAAAAGQEAAASTAPSLLSAMPGGADVGTFVHRVLEGADFTAVDLGVELRASLARTAARQAVDVGERSVVVAGLAAAVETPLGPVVGDVRLRDIGRADRVDELGFELPLCGGDAPAGRLAVASIGALLSEHLPAGDPLATYASRLSDPALQSELRGYLAGSLDLVLRTPDRRYAVVDYKTNRLGAAGGALSAWHYRPAALCDAMFAAHYPLQALLYTVALHRYLRWRVVGYDVERDLAGVLYLFLRGMVGASTPRVEGVPCGVFGWRPPAPLVLALSDLLDRGST